MFALDQQPAVVFATNLITSDCRDAANVGHPACTAEAQGRRRLQGAACPAAEFTRRDAELREVCVGFGRIVALLPLIPFIPDLLRESVLFAEATKCDRTERP